MSVKERFENLLFEGSQEIICYHATRLVSYEAEDIKIKSLSIMNEAFLKYKINNLFYNKIINSTESEILIETYFLNYYKQRLARENKLYFIYGNQDIRYTENNTSYIFPFYSNYGGEVIFNGLSVENPGLLEKLNKVSKPYIIICSVPLDNIKDKLNFHMESIIINYHKGALFNIKNEFYIDNNYFKVLDVVEVNEQTEFTYD